MLAVCLDEYILHFYYARLCHFEYGMHRGLICLLYANLIQVLESAQGTYAKELESFVGIYRGKG
jgi:hypothetical protein